MIGCFASPREESGRKAGGEQKESEGKAAVASFAASTQRVPPPSNHCFNSTIRRSLIAVRASKIVKTKREGSHQLQNITSLFVIGTPLNF